MIYMQNPDIIAEKNPKQTRSLDYSKDSGDILKRADLCFFTSRKGSYRRWK